MLTSRGITRLSRRAVNGAKRTSSLFSTSASVLTKAGLSASAGTQSSLRPTRFAASTSGKHSFAERHILHNSFSCLLLFSRQMPF